MANSNPEELIYSTLKEKAVLKQEVFKNTMDVFGDLRTALEALQQGMVESIKDSESGVKVEYQEKSEFQAEIKFGGDLLMFHMHSNVFGFDRGHEVWKQTYVKEDQNRSYCGVINVYNFLADSFKYNRMNDLGYMIARIFVNKDKHFFVEGKRQLGFLYNDFANSILEPEMAKSIVESAILYSMDFDLLTPPYDSVKEVSVLEMKEISLAANTKTGKRLGFRFHADDDNIE